MKVVDLIISVTAFIVYAGCLIFFACGYNIK